MNLLQIQIRNILWRDILYNTIRGENIELKSEKYLFKSAYRAGKLCIFNYMVKKLIQLFVL